MHNHTTSAPPPPAVKEGRFDDAPIDGSGDNYNDDTHPGTVRDNSDGDDDFDTDNDLARVEDEDWEIAKRGGCSNPTLLYLRFDLPS